MAAAGRTADIDRGDQSKIGETIKAIQKGDFGIAVAPTAPTASAYQPTTFNKYVSFVAAA